MAAPHNTADVYPEIQLTPYTFQHFPVDLIYGWGNACLQFPLRQGWHKNLVLNEAPEKKSSSVSSVTEVANDEEASHLQKNVQSICWVHSHSGRYKWHTIVKEWWVPSSCRMNSLPLSSWTWCINHCWSISRKMLPLMVLSRNKAS